MSRRGFREHPAAPKLAGKRVIIAEDDSDNRRILETVLHAVGAETLPAASIDELLAYTDAANEIDLVVADWNLGGLTVKNALNDFVGRRPELASRVLVVTGGMLRRAGENDATAAGYPVLLKPFSPTDLIAAFGKLLA